MSITLYNGWKLNMASLKAIQRWARPARQKFEKLRAKMILDRFPTLIGPDKDDALQWYDQLQAMQREAAASPMRNPLADYTAKFLIFPMRGYFLALTYWQNYEYDDVWGALPKVEEYRYWDNTDPPVEITAQQWRLRQKHWDQAIPGFSRPIDHGFMFNILSETIPWPDEMCRLARRKAPTTT